MAKYSGTFSCGHEGTVGIIGPMKDREWKKERAFSKLCPECYEKHLKEQIEKENLEAEEKSKEWELPKLTGTEKQISWANTIRIQIVENIKNKAKDDSDYNLRCYCSDTDFKSSDVINNIEDIIDYMLVNKTDSKFYIENRNKNLTLAADLYKEMLDLKKKEKEQIENKEVISQSTLIPKDAKFTGVVEIHFASDIITASYEKNDTFRNVVKSLNYSWNNGRWERNLSEMTGSYIDRAAELGNKLLNAGFSVFILDESIRNKALNADYEVECTRWILRRKGTSKLVLKWNGQNDSLYNASRKIPGSKWDKGTLIDVSHYKEVEEFAEMYGFKSSKSAKELIDRYIDEFSNISAVEVANVKEKVDKDGLNDILNSSRDILSDLKEED